MPKEKTTVKVKKKNWFEILAPRLFDERIIGETTVTESSKLIGRPVLLNMMVLTNDPRKQSINVKFAIHDVKDNKAFTKIVGYYLSSSYLRRLMRRATTRIDDSLLVETSDDVRVRIKLFLLTRKYVTGSISTNVRKQARSFVLKQVKKNTYEKLIIGIITSKFQRSLSAFLKKIYPLKSCEIKSMEIEKRKKKAEEKVKEAPKKEEPKPKETKKESPKEPKPEPKKEEVKEERK